MNLLSFLIFLPLVYLLGFLPGRLLVQILPIDYRVKFASSFGVSFFIYFLAAFLSYIFRIPPQNMIISLFIFLLPISIIIIYYRPWIPSKDEIIFIIIFFLAFFLTVSILSLIPYYSGAKLFWDWYEHFVRSQIFLNHLPEWTRFGGILLPQRMPLFNATASFMMSILGREFWIYQTIAVLLNLTVLLPCYLILSIFTKSKNQIVLFVFITILFLLNPYINALLITYAATKPLTAYYVLLGLYFIFALIKQNKFISIYLSVIFLGISQLVHVMAFPYILVSIFFLFIITIRLKYLKHLLLSSFLFIALLSIWYVWSYKTYGLDITFFSSRIMEESAFLSLSQRIDLIKHNIFYTTVPYISKEYFDATFNNINYSVMIYDRILTFYSTNMPLALSLNILFAFIILLLIKVQKKIVEKSLIINIKFEHFLIFIFVISGYFHTLYSALYSDSGGAHWIMVPSVFLLFSLGLAVIIKLVKRFGNLYIFFTVLLIAIESLIGIGYKLYIAKYQLDPKINTSIDLNRDLLSLPEPARYTNFAVHLLNYKLKEDNRLIFLSNKFLDLQPLFIIVTILGWIGLQLLLNYIFSKRNLL